jgi:lipopolysaccharide export system protein LptA
LTKSIYNHSALLNIDFTWGLILIIFFALAFPAVAQETVTEGSLPASDSPIRITADKLITDPQNKTAEFIGHVSASQDDTTITSDRLKVYYREGSETEGTPGMDAIVRIVAEGTVKMVLEDQIAHTEHAEYIADQRIIILTGPNSKIVSGNNSISGQKITLYRDDGRIHVAGTTEKPVEAFFYSDENGLAVPKKKN